MFGILKLKQIYFLSVGSGEDKSFLLKYWDMLRSTPDGNLTIRLFLHKGNVICEPSEHLALFEQSVRSYLLWLTHCTGSLMGPLPTRGLCHCQNICESRVPSNLTSFATNLSMTLGKLIKLPMPPLSHDSVCVKEILGMIGKHYVKVYIE